MRRGANHAGAHQGEHGIRPGRGEAGKRRGQHQPDQQRLAGNTRRHCAGKQSRQGAYPAIGGDGEAHAGFRLVKIRRQGAEHAHRRQFAGDDRKAQIPSAMTAIQTRAGVGLRGKAISFMSGVS